MLITGRGETGPNLAIELDTVWILMLLLKRGILNKGKRAYLLDIKLRIEYFNI